MRRIIFCLPLLFLIGCSKPETTEELVLLDTFGSYVSAMAYDEICNKTDPKSRYDFSQEQNVLLIGNQNLLAGRVGAIWHVRYPHQSIEDGVKMLQRVQGNLKSKVEKRLKDQGCHTEYAISLVKPLKMYKSTHPALLNVLIDKKIEARGGQVTPSSVINATP